MGDNITTPHNIVEIDSILEEDIHPSIFMLSMSTCEPCMKAKQFLHEQGYSFNYVDVDTADEEDWDKALDQMDSLPPQGIKMIFPVIIIDSVKIIHGFDEKGLIKSLHARASEQ